MYGGCRGLEKFLAIALKHRDGQALLESDKYVNFSYYKYLSLFNNDIQIHTNIRLLFPDL